MKKNSEFIFVLLLISAIMVSACGQATATTAEPSFPTTIPVFIPLVGSHAATSTAEPSTPVVTLSATTTLLATTLTMQIPSTVPVPLPAAGALSPGTYLISILINSIDNGHHKVIFSLPAGWATSNGLVYKHLGQPAEVSFSAWFVDKIYDDPCHWQASSMSSLDISNKLHDVTGVPLITSKDGGLSNQAFRGAGVRSLTRAPLGGWTAWRIDLSIPTILDIATCDQGEYRSWTSRNASDGANSHNAAGQRDSVFMVDVDRGPLVIDASYMPAASAADLAELQAILASMIIDGGGFPQTIPHTLLLDENGRVVSPWYDAILDAGTYTYVNIGGQGFNLRFTVPANWTWGGNSLGKGNYDRLDGAYLTFTGEPVEVYADPCHLAGLHFATGFSIINAFTSQPSRIATSPVDRPARSLDGSNPWPGMAVELSTYKDLNLAECLNGQYMSIGGEPNGQSYVNPGQHDYLWVVDTSGSGVTDSNRVPVSTPAPRGLLIDATTWLDTPVAILSEIQSILDSIVISYGG